MRKEQLNQPSFIEDLNLLACFDLKNLELGIEGAAGLRAGYASGRLTSSRQGYHY